MSRTSGSDYDVVHWGLLLEQVKETSLSCAVLAWSGSNEQSYQNLSTFPVVYTVAWELALSRQVKMRL
jgi:hypothetical protein